MIRYIAGLMISIPLMASAIEIKDDFVYLTVQSNSMINAEDLAVKRAKSFLNDNLSQNYNNTFVKTDEKVSDVKMLNAKSSVYTVTSSKCEKHGESWSCKVGYVYDIDKSKKVVSSLLVGKEYEDKEMIGMIDETGDINYEKIFLKLNKQYEEVSQYLFSRAMFDKEYRIKSFSYFKNHTFNPSTINVGFYLENPNMEYLKKYFYLELSGDVITFKPKGSDVIVPVKDKLTSCGVKCLSQSERALLADYYLSSLLIVAIVTPGNLTLSFDLEKSIIKKDSPEEVVGVVDDDVYHEGDFLFANVISLNNDGKLFGKNVFRTSLINYTNNSFFINLKENVKLTNAYRTKHLRKEGEDTFYSIKDVNLKTRNLVFSQYFK